MLIIVGLQAVWEQQEVKTLSTGLGREGTTVWIAITRIECQADVAALCNSSLGRQTQRTDSPEQTSWQD